MNSAPTENLITKDVKKIDRAACREQGYVIPVLRGGCMFLPDDARGIPLTEPVATPPNPKVARLIIK